VPPGRGEEGERRPRIVLIREWEAQTSASGCCGRLEGQFFEGMGSGERVFPKRRADMEAMGPLYMALRRGWGDRIRLHVVDPRDLLTLIALLFGDARRCGIPLGTALRTLFRLPLLGVLLDGRLVASGRWPSLEEIIHLLPPGGEGASATSAATSAAPTASRPSGQADS